MKDYEIRLIPCKLAKEYIIKNHYSHGCHNAPSPCYGLFEENNLIGVCMFATPCSENVRASVWGEEYKDRVIELHRLHILDITPKNTESWFISRCINMLLIDKPRIRGIISFADETQGHKGVIYQATNFWYIGKSSKATFYLDDKGRLHHPRQNGVNISKEEAKLRGWKPTKRISKNRYLFIVANDKREKKQLIKSCKYDLINYKWCISCGREMSKNNYYNVCDKCLDAESKLKEQKNEFPRTDNN